MNPNLPVGGSAFDLQLGSRGALPEDVTQLALTQSYSRYGREYQGSERVDLEAPRLDVWLTQLVARHHFGSGWAADLTLPAGTIIVEARAGEPTRRLSGFGDMELGGSYDLAAWWGAGGYRPSLTLRLGLGLPTGRQDRLGEEGDAVPPNVLSIGNGAYGAVAELRLTQFVARRVAVSPSVSARSPLGANDSGVTMGATTVLGVDALVFPSTWLFATAGGSLQSRGHSTEEGEGRIRNSGGRTFAASLSAGVLPAKRLTLGVGARLPLYTYAHGRQISESYTVLATLGVSFGGEEHEHGADEAEHEHHEHGTGEAEQEHHDHGEQAGHGASEPDLRDAARGGESFEIASALAAGKITVIDFWADWCHPCKHIEATLRRLASESPDLAVRRVEVPDFESAVARRYLGGESSLPLLWLYDGRGVRRKIVRRAEDVEPAVRELLGPRVP